MTEKLQITAKDTRPLLLTGASGVIGSEVVRLIPPHALLLGRHRARPDSSARQVAIDIRQPRLGMTPTEYTHLTQTISGILHCAAITDMNGVAEGLHETNIDGVKHILALAGEAGVPLHYVSTAYCSQAYGPKRPVQSAYVSSKRAAEALVRESDVDWTIARPSIVVGHSQTGEIASFQGFHLFITSILKGRLPFIPLDRLARCDFVPADYVAAALASLVRAPEFGRTYWLTGGAQAITIEEMMAYGQPFAGELGKDLTQLTIADPETIRRAHLPALRDKFPARLMERLDVLMELSSVMATARPFPSDLANLLPDHAKLDGARLKTFLGHNLRYWGKVNKRPFETQP